MNAQSEKISLKEAIELVKSKSHPDGIYVKEIISTFGMRSHAFVILFFCLPFIQPLPMMGLSTIFGGGIILLSFFMAINKSPWLPKKFAKKHISASLIDSCCNVLLKFLGKTEKFIRPRFSFWMHNFPFRIFNSFLLGFFAFLLALPLPIPFSNSVPTYFLLLNVIALLEDDGILVLVSYVVAIGGLIFFASLGLGATEFIEFMRGLFCERLGCLCNGYWPPSC